MRISHGFIGQVFMIGPKFYEVFYWLSSPLASAEVCPAALCPAAREVAPSPRKIMTIHGVRSPPLGPNARARLTRNPSRLLLSAT